MFTDWWRPGHQSWGRVHCAPPAGGSQKCLRRIICASGVLCQNWVSPRRDTVSAIYRSSFYCACCDTLDEIFLNENADWADIPRHVSCRKLGRVISPYTDLAANEHSFMDVSIAKCIILQQILSLGSSSVADCCSHIQP